MPITEPAFSDVPAQPLVVFLPAAAFPADHAVAPDPSDSCLIEHQQEFGADLEQGQPSQKVQPALSLSVDGVGVQ